MKPPVVFNQNSPFYLKNMIWVYVDLDDCLYESRPPLFELKKLKPKAKHFMWEMVKMGHKPIIFTSRHEAEYPYIEHCLKRDKIPFREIRCGKPMGRMYIDDKGFRLKDWNVDGPEILKLLS